MNDPTTQSRVSRIITARNEHSCRRCSITIKTGEQQFMFAQGASSWLPMHIECAQRLGLLEKAQ